MNNPLVSIIIPTYNRATIIWQTLDSILAQTYQQWECIVIDDGSEDSTATVLGGYIQNDSRFKYVDRPQTLPKGPNLCRNYGFTISSGDFVLWFDSDDLIFPNALELLIRSRTKKTDAIIARTDCIDLETKNKIKTNKIHSENLLEDYFIGKVTFYIGGVLWNKNFLLKQNELFDVNIRNMDDWDFNLRMLYQNPQLVFLDDVLFQYRLHKDSFSNELRKLNKNELISEFNARDKHLKIVAKRNDIQKEVIQAFIIKRNKKYLKIAIAGKEKNVYFLYKRLFLYQLKFRRIIDSLKTTIGFLSFLITGRGYVFFKNYK